MALDISYESCNRAMGIYTSSIEYEALKVRFYMALPNDYEGLLVIIPGSIGRCALCVNLFERCTRSSKIADRRLGMMISVPVRYRYQQ